MRKGKEIPLAQKWGKWEQVETSWHGEKLGKSTSEYAGTHDLKP